MMRKYLVKNVEKEEADDKGVMVMVAAPPYLEVAPVPANTKEEGHVFVEDDIPDVDAAGNYQKTLIYEHRKFIAVPKRIKDANNEVSKKVDELIQQKRTEQHKKDLRLYMSQRRQRQRQLHKRPSAITEAGLVELAQINKDLQRVHKFLLDLAQKDK